MEVKDANLIPLEDILNYYERPIKHSYAGYDMYCSPFRNESAPSFQVINSSNKWKDFGSGEYGSVVDLIMKMESCSFSEAMNLVSQGKFKNVIGGNSNTAVKAKEVKQIKTVIQKVAPLQNKILLSYLHDQRGIDNAIAQKYCKEVYYKHEGSDKNLFAVAFENDSNGLEFRNGAGYKGAFINKNITTIDNNSSSCAVFEGFMDFLSYQQLMKDEPQKQNINFVILNSIAMTEKAIPFLSRHNQIHSFLDNDPAGRRAFQTLKKIPDVQIVNESEYLYHDKKDLNEYLVDMVKKKEELISQGNSPSIEAKTNSVKLKL